MPDDSRQPKQSRPLEAKFGTSTPYSLGVEEEFQVVDAETLELVQSAVEVSTRISVNVEEAVADLLDLRRRLGRAAADDGAVIVSAGSYPLPHSEGLTWPAGRRTVCGLHIHVGVSSAAKAIACANGLRHHVPELLALSANSPFSQGRQTGLASTRAVVVRDLPRTGLPPALASYDEYERLVQWGVETGCFPDYTHLRWDIRPHPALGTVEVRICDAQTRIENVAALAALVQSLTAKLGSDFECGETAASGSDLLLEENKWRATRDGLAARLIDLDDGTERAADDAIRALVDSCAPAADALGCAEELSLVPQILVRGNGADEQLFAYDETRDLVAVTRGLGERTAAPHALALDRRAPSLTT